MPREIFQQELDGLIGDVLDLGKEVEGSLENMVVAMEARDADVAGRELGVDLRYKALFCISGTTYARRHSFTKHLSYLLPFRTGPDPQDQRPGGIGGLRDKAFVVRSAWQRTSRCAAPASQAS